MTTITIGFVPRERFSLAAESLQRLYEYTTLPFHLIIVNCNIPKVYWQQMETVLEGRENFEVIHRDHYLLPNQSKNLVIQAAKGEFLCLIENDVLVKEGWLAKLIKACEEHPADVAVPLIIEGHLHSKKVHFDNLLGTVEAVPDSGETKLRILPRQNLKNFTLGAKRRTVQFMEQHCLLFRRNVFERIGLYDERLNTRDEVDLSLALYEAKVPVVFEPNCVIHYLPPYPPQPDELDYFFKKWELNQAIQSRQLIQEKWNLVDLPGDMRFVEDRNLIGQLHQVKKELLSLVKPTEPFILADQDQWRGTSIVEGLKVIPFIEREGEYWGLPGDDEAAIEELERQRQAGIKLIVFGWPAFWLRDHCSRFYSYLQTNFHCLLNNDRLMAFELN